MGLLLTAPALALGDGPDDKPKDAPPADMKARRAARDEAMAIFRDLQELTASLDKEKAEAEKRPPVDILEKAGRPAKSVGKTSVDSASIDAMLEASHKDAKIAPARVTTDEEFIRRVTLDVTGKLPSPEQVVAFRESKNKQKRAELVDSLLTSPDYARNWARYWKDVIQYHATAQNPGLVRFPSLEDWLTEQFRKNRPWDEVSTELITATGNTGENGAAVLVGAHQAQAVELAGEVSRIFMGVQIQCAQCHDHPTDEWKREQFHQFAAFFGGLQARQNRNAENGPSLDVTERKGAVSYRMPDLKDPQVQIPVAPKFFLVSSESPLPPRLTSTELRKLAASYVTGQDNPWFAKAFVNRVWYSLMGDGFVNPVDDLGPTRETNNPEVMDALAEGFAQGGYDVRWLFQTILNTKTYQREFRSIDTASGKTPFAANCPSRLRADQILDSLAQALNLKFDNVPGLNKKGMPQAKQTNAQKIMAAAARLRGGPRGVFNLTFGVDPSIPNDEVLGTIPQALFLMNSGQIDQAIKGQRGTVLTEILSKNPDNRAALEALYLRVLARSPNDDEVRTCGKYLENVGNRREAFEDILWALINSTEFVSRK